MNPVGHTAAAPVSHRQGRGFRLVQISDCHLSARPETPYRGLNAGAGLAAVVVAAGNWQPDAVMLTGDLSEDASPESYHRLAAFMDELNVPVYALPGNHDESGQMSGFFPLGAYQHPYLKQAGNWNLVLLNSSVPGRIDGRISKSDLEILDKLLEAEKPTLLALHHQPVPVEAPWIDRYMLEQPEALLHMIAGKPNLKAVTWGHVHQAFEKEIGKVRFMSAPSSAANSLPASQRFTQDPAGPACRWFELFDDGRFESGILYAM